MYTITTPCCYVLKTPSIPSSLQTKQVSTALGMYSQLTGVQVIFQTALYTQFNSSETC